MYKWSTALFGKEINETNFHLSRLDLLCRLLQDQSNQDQLDSKPEIMTSGTEPNTM